MILRGDIIISKEKIEHYLLKPMMFSNKWIMFSDLGYTISDANRLIEDIRNQVLTQHTTVYEQNVYGVFYQISSHFTGINNKTIEVDSIWLHEKKSMKTKFITIYIKNKTKFHS